MLGVFKQMEPGKWPCVVARHKNQFSWCPANLTAASGCQDVSADHFHRLHSSHWKVHLIWMESGNDLQPGPQLQALSEQHTIWAACHARSLLL